ncbi:hypothetical protein Ct9H90mP29_01990 [bacterium]|nr:MAG: hypothetical protein Ct9H90mP29_01990 [bacterium]
MAQRGMEKKASSDYIFWTEYCNARNHNLKECLICSWAASKKRIRKEMN